MRKRNRKTTFTKKIVSILLIVAVIDLQLTYILAFLGMTETLQETSGKLITEILGVVLVYCIKSFFETKEEKKNELEKERIDNMNPDEEDSDFRYNYLNGNK